GCALEGLVGPSAWRLRRRRAHRKRICTPLLCVSVLQLRVWSLLRLRLSGVLQLRVWSGVLLSAVLRLWRPDLFRLLRRALLNERPPGPDQGAREGAPCANFLCAFLDPRCPHHQRPAGLFDQRHACRALSHPLSSPSCCLRVRSCWGCRANSPGRRAQAKAIKSLRLKEPNPLPRLHQTARPRSRASVMRSRRRREKMTCRSISLPG